MGAFLPVPPIMGGAVEKGWFALAQEFARAGHDVMQISRAVPQLARNETIAGVKHLRIAGFDAPASLLWLKFLDLVYSIRVLRAIPASDIILTNTFWIPMLLRNRKRGSLYLHVARFPKGQMRFYKHAARLQAPSRSVADAIVAEVPAAASRVKTIPYPRPQTHTAEPPTFSQRPSTILYVGRVHPEKGVHLLVGAFASLPQDMRDHWQLDIVGPVDSRYGGGGEDYRHKLEETSAKAAARIHFRGPIFDAAELERAFRSAALFVYPSLAEKGETFGLAPLEAMTHGCPVLVSDLGCFHDFVTAGETGFMFDHRSADPRATLRAKLEELLRDPAQLFRVGEAGYRVSENYTLERVARQFLADFEAVVAESHV